MQYGGNAGANVGGHAGDVRRIDTIALQAWTSHASARNLASCCRGNWRQNVQVGFPVGIGAPQDSFLANVLCGALTIGLIEARPVPLR